MSAYTPPALNAVDFALTAHTVPSIASPTQALSPYSVPTLTAVDFSLIAYTQPTYQNIGWELLPSGGTAYADTLSVGAYAISGKDITDVVTVAGTAYEDDLSVGAYVIAGQTVSDSVAKADALSVGAYVVGGNALSDAIAKSDNLSTGAYSIAGQSVSDSIAYADSLNTGAYSIVGKDVSDSVVISEIYSGGFATLNEKRKKKPEPLPEFHPWIHSPLVKHYVETVEPEIVEAVIKVVAKTVEKRTVQDKDLETARAEKEFRAYLYQQQAEWKEMYAQLIRLEYERREQEYEDAQIALMLFEL